MAVNITKKKKILHLSQYINTSTKTKTPLEENCMSISCILRTEKEKLKQELTRIKDSYYYGLYNYSTEQNYFC